MHFYQNISYSILTQVCQKMEIHTPLMVWTVLTWSKLYTNMHVRTHPITSEGRCVGHTYHKRCSLNHDSWIHCIWWETLGNYLKIVCILYLIVIQKHAPNHIREKVCRAHTYHKRCFPKYYYTILGEEKVGYLEIVCIPCLLIIKRPTFRWTSLFCKGFLSITFSFLLNNLSFSD